MFVQMHFLHYEYESRAYTNCHDFILSFPEIMQFDVVNALMFLSVVLILLHINFLRRRIYSINYQIDDQYIQSQTF